MCAGPAGRSHVTRATNRTRALVLDRLVSEVSVLPLRALPFIAPATLRPGIVARALADPDQRGSIAGFSLGGDLGPLEYRSPAEFRRSMHALHALDSSSPFRDFVACLPAGIVTPFDDARRLHWELVAHMALLQIDEVANDTWEEAPVLTVAERKLVFEGFPRPFIEQRGVFRTNSATFNINVISEYCDELFRRARAGGMTVVPSSLPGTKAQLRQAIRQMATGVKPIREVADATFDDYLVALGLRWHAGRPRSDDPWASFL